MARIPKAKRCPFCASGSSFVECLDFGSFAVICNDCGARGPQADGEACDPFADKARGERQAIRAWNRRARSPALRAAMSDGSRG